MNNFRKIIEKIKNNKQMVIITCGIRITDGKKLGELLKENLNADVIRYRESRDELTENKTKSINGDIIYDDLFEKIKESLNKNDIVFIDAGFAKRNLREKLLEIVPENYKSICIFFDYSMDKLCELINNKHSADTKNPFKQIHRIKNTTIEEPTLEEKFGYIYTITDNELRVVKE